jgi:hypothetical protein
MATQLPLDVSHLAVREYVNLIRFQVLNPLSTVVSVVAALARSLPNYSCTTHPSLSETDEIYWDRGRFPLAECKASPTPKLQRHAIAQGRTFALYDNHTAHRI